MMSPDRAGGQAPGACASARSGRGSTRRRSRSRESTVQARRSGTATSRSPRRARRVAAARPTNSGHQLCGLKKPSSPVPCSISPSLSSSGRLRQPPAGEQHVEPGQEGQADGERQRGAAGRVVRTGSSRRCRRRRRRWRSQGTASPRPSCQYPCPRQLVRRPAVLISGSAPIAWRRPGPARPGRADGAGRTPGRSDLIRGIEVKLCLGGGQDVAHSSELLKPHGSSSTTRSPCFHVLYTLQKKNRLDTPRMNAPIVETWFSVVARSRQSRVVGGAPGLADHAEPVLHQERHVEADEHEPEVPLAERAR